jgi:hypothetical protein
MPSVLALNQPVQFEVYDPATTSPCRSRGVVKDLTERGVLLTFSRLSTPPSCWAVGCGAVLRYGDHLGMHWTETRIREITKGRPVTVLLPPELDFSTAQRRRFLRVPARFSVAVSIVDSTVPETIGIIDKHSLTEDLSAGGMRFSTHLKLHIGDVLDTVITVSSMRLRDVEVFHLPAAVVRLCGTDALSTGLFPVACEFVFARDAEQARLVRLVQLLQPRY